MFYEELDCITFDYDQLVADVRKHVFPLGAQVVQGEEYETPAYHGFGGWSITSRRGTWKDGWDFFQNDDGEAMETYFPNNSNNYKTLKFFDIAMSMEHKNPTEACQGSIADVVQQIEALGFYPRRVRVTCLKAGAKSLVHKDANDDEYMARIHIPLITNPACVFISNGVNLFMEPRKAYMVWVNDWHQIRNDSLEDRYHIIMDAYDTRGVTKNFKYHGDIQELIDHSNRVRDNIEAAELTQEEWNRFEALRQTFVTQPKHPDPIKDPI
jgi:hypothetical protein